ncbi:ATP-binding cassette domain-containing protein [Thiomicrorhabdus sp.]|uniref:ATP-binding cassette domain-containing protein n=1 Tax=Thiomicrorhabdus sp. TaxID=2039724 RepID=UPI0029C95954|nr:ATP-binding cassette domain-containing protein [Thiomicrorhabdus sp.]
MFEIRQLSYTCNGQVLLQPMDVKLRSGQIHVLLGENGAGKSTLLRCLSGALHTMQGEVLLDGKLLTEWSLPELAKKRAHLGQRQENAFAFSVRQLVALGLEVQGPGKQDDSQLQEILHCFDLHDLAERSISTLSGGELQRAHFARTIAQIWPTESHGEQRFSGKWLLLDEWYAGLDLKHQISLLRKMKQWCHEGLSIVMVVHDLHLAQALADRCLLLKNGELLFYGSAQEALQPDRLRQLLEVEVHVDNEQGYLRVDF